MINKSQRITICSVGDLMICDSPLYASVGVGSKYLEIKDRLFNDCKTTFDDADIAIGNFETVVHKPKNKSLKESQMSCPETIVEDLKKVGFSILNIANNHCMQHGTDGFNKTKDICERCGIKPIGVRDEEPYIKEINGVQLAFLALCIHLEWYEPNHILYENRIERIIKEVGNLRKKDPDMFIIMSVHWGDEFATYPSNAQIALAHKLVDCGVNVILGHHAHVYQGIEEYKGAVVVYGQGNFVSDMVPEMCRQTGIVRIDIDKQKKITYKLYPYLIGDGFNLTSSEGEWIKERQAELQGTLDGKYADDDYWKTITRNHSSAHNDFKVFFKRNLRKYNLRISTQMIWEFVGRKIKRLIGTSSDGQISSMDSEIFEVLKKMA